MDDMSIFVIVPNLFIIISSVSIENDLLIDILSIFSFCCSRRFDNIICLSFSIISFSSNTEVFGVDSFSATSLQEKFGLATA
jgi:hypothetical protein